MSTHKVYGCYNAATGAVEWHDTAAGCESAVLSACLVQSGEHAGKIKVTHSCNGVPTDYYVCAEAGTGKWAVDVDDGCCEKYICDDCVNPASVFCFTEDDPNYDHLLHGYVERTRDCYWKGYYTIFPDGEGGEVTLGNQILPPGDTFDCATGGTLGNRVYTPASSTDDCPVMSPCPCTSDQEWWDLTETPAAFSVNCSGMSIGTADTDCYCPAPTSWSGIITRGYGDATCFYQNEWAGNGCEIWEGMAHESTFAKIYTDSLYGTYRLRLEVKRIFHKLSAGYVTAPLFKGMISRTSGPYSLCEGPWTIPGDSFDPSGNPCHNAGGGSATITALS